MCIDSPSDPMRWQVWLPLVQTRTWRLGHPARGHTAREKQRPGLSLLPIACWVMTENVRSHSAVRATSLREVPPGTHPWLRPPSARGLSFSPQSWRVSGPVLKDSHQIAFLSLLLKLSLSAVSLLCLGLKDNNRVLSYLPKFGEIPKFLPLGLDSITLA